MNVSPGEWKTAELAGTMRGAPARHGPGGRRGAAGAAASAPARQVPRGRSSQATRPREAAEHEKGPGTPPRTGRRSGRDEGERAVQTHARRAAPTGAEQGATGLCWWSRLTHGPERAEHSGAVRAAHWIRLRASGTKSASPQRSHSAEEERLGLGPRPPACTWAMRGLLKPGPDALLVEKVAAHQPHAAGSPSLYSSRHRAHSISPPPSARRERPPHRHRPRPGGRPWGPGMVHARGGSSWEAFARKIGRIALQSGR
ncbi:unnamed protein product [Prorocentrum cordatum]|uniref:Uncharacterized protein n=1 Tax=Prorocentrum cordatum TaxID=2364126 RepID=A0ABN9XDF9_9DINO|nr:unnamed protein product [Polarella glacialis]